MSGYPQSGGPNSYIPNNNVTRGEMAKSYLINKANKRLWEFSKLFDM